MHRKKRGQIAIALVLAVAAIVLFFVVMTLQKKAVEAPPEPAAAAPIRGLVTACLRDELQNGAYLIGKQGGYVTLGTDKFEMDNVSLGVFAHRARIVAPNIAQLEADLGDYIDLKLPSCVIEGQRGIEYNLTFKQTKSKVQITPTKIAVTTDFPVTATIGGRVETVHEFSTVIDVRIGMLRGIAEAILADRQSHIGYWDVTYLSDLAVPVEMRVLNETYVVFTLLDNESVTRIEKPYLYNVALDSPPNEPPQMMLPEKFTLRVGQRFQFKVSAVDPEGDPIRIFAPNEHFIVGPDGRIDFTPRMVGNFEVQFEAHDDKEAFSIGDTKFEVLP